jgi:hypothetical protein
MPGKLIPFRRATRARLDRTIWVGGPVSKSIATLRVKGEKLDPLEISKLLRATPTDSCRKGDRVGKSRMAPMGSWSLEVHAKASPDQQIRRLLATVTNDLRVWRRLSLRFNVDIFIGIFLERPSEMFVVKPETLKLLARRRIALTLDMYGD